MIHLTGEDADRAKQASSHKRFSGFLMVMCTSDHTVEFDNNNDLQRPQTPDSFRAVDAENREEPWKRGEYAHGDGGGSTGITQACSRIKYRTSSGNAPSLLENVLKRFLDCNKSRDSLSSSS